MTPGTVAELRADEELLAVIPPVRCKQCGAHSRLGYVPRNQAVPADTWRDVLRALGVLGLVVVAMYACVIAAAAYWLLDHSRPIPGGVFGV